MALIQKAFSDIITFSRSSNATRVGPTGLVEYAPHNLLTYSEDFTNAAWTLADTSITANSAAAPNGTVTADTFTASAAGYKSIYRTETVVSGTVYTVSIYAKAKTTSFVSIEFRGSGSSPDAIFNLSTGVVSSGTGAITSVGNGWYRCSVTKTSIDTSELVIIGFNGSGANTGDSIYIWGAQLSVGPYALDYTPTTSAAVYGPRFDYDGSGVTIVEPVSRNLLTYSEQFDNGAWSKAGITVSANDVSAPDGTVTAEKIVANTNNTDHDVYRSDTITAASYTLSVYAKYAGAHVALSAALSSGTWCGAIFDLQNGVAKTPQGANATCTAAIQNVGNGWYRCSITFTGTASGWYSIINLTDNVNATMGAYGFITYAGDGSSGIYVWGAQLEVGSTATAYMVSGATNGFRAVPVVSGSATPKGLLIEEQRTNTCLYSEDFSNAAWTKSGATISANNSTAPDGQTTADKIVEDSATSAHEVFQSISITSGSSYTFSFFAKAAGRNYVAINHNGTGSYATSYFNLSNGTVVSSGAGYTNSIQSYGNGWYRVISTFTSATTSSVAFEILASDNGSRTSYAGDGSSGILVWGAQLE